MDVILLERVAKLGDMGEIVKVKDGYGRNYLLSQGKALRVNAANMARFEEQKAHLEAQNAETRADAQKQADRIDGETFVIIRSASDAGALYGSVTPRDAADAAAADGHTVDRKNIVLGAPIKYLGLHEVLIKLHPEVEATITLNVARSSEEAELQASGKSIRDMAAEEEAAAEFEIQELFDDIGGAANEYDHAPSSSRSEESAEEPSED